MGTKSPNALYMQKTDSPANNNFATKADILLCHCPLCQWTTLTVTLVQLFFITAIMWHNFQQLTKEVPDPHSYLSYSTNKGDCTF